MKTALIAREILTPLDRIIDGLVVFEDGVVLEAGSRECIEIPRGARQVDLGDGVLSPGFIDIHVHGGGGHDVMGAVKMRSMPLSAACLHTASPATVRQR